MGNTGISGSAGNVVFFVLSKKSQDDGVFARPGPKNENLHPSRVLLRSTRFGGHLHSLTDHIRGQTRDVPMPKISDADGRTALMTVRDALGAGQTPDRTQLALTSRWLLQRLERESPGNSVEVRVPPFGAVQFVEGPRHTRGTPPNVVEMDARTFVALATGSLAWVAGVSAGAIRASGIRSDISAFFPLNLGGE